jgi:hypothetical protein
MAEGHINTAFSALGTIDIILKRSVQGLALWRRIDNFTQSVQDFKIRLEWERSMLVFWGQEWGIEKKSHLKNRTFQKHGDIIVQYLHLIDRISNELSRLDSAFPSFNTSNKSAYTEPLPDPYHQTSPIPTEVESIESFDGANSSSTAFRFAPKRLKWALQEERLDRSLGLLSNLIRSLYAFLPPPNSDAAGPIVFGASLASQDAASLARVSHVIDSAPALSEMAWIKSIAYSTTVGPAPRLYEPKLVLHPTDDKRHFMGTYDGSNVFVEQKNCISPGTDSTWRVVLDARIENIVVRLKVSPKPTELRILPCLGATISHLTTDDSSTSIYRLVYRTDAPKLCSFRDVLSSGNAQRYKAHLPLGQRFRIGQTLARAVLYLHMADWLHKAIRSKNMLFFMDNVADLKSTLPYLVGFEYSRPDALGQQTEEVIEDKESRFYRHPKAGKVSLAGPKEPLGGIGTYSKAYDIYSVGVVLVEIGLFIPAYQIVKQYYKEKDQNKGNDPSGEDIRNILIQKAIPMLRFTMGEVYADATYACLKVLPDELNMESLDARFYTDVVRKLELCEV